jgi:chromosomal replication initiation ATPase DnaA
MWLLRKRESKTLKEIGLLFGEIDYAAVGQRIRRLERQIGKKKDLGKTCEMLNV